MSMAHSPHAPSPPTPKQIRVCIIGAGISGLRAASLLCNTNTNTATSTSTSITVTILEARNRVGGRVAQSTRFGTSLDTGASWIHGTEGNPFVRLAAEAGSAVVASGAVDSICGADGAWIEAGTAGAYYEEVWEVLGLAMERSRRALAGAGGEIGEEVRMMDFFREEVKRRARAGSGSGSGSGEGAFRKPDGYDYEGLMLQIVEMWGAFMGDDCENQSLRNLALDAGLDGDNLLVASTFKDIIHRLLLAVGHKATLCLNCEVTSIASDPRPTGSPGVTINASDGFSGTFDDVIVTAPLGWLKRNSHVFSPPLSPPLGTAIQSLGYGNLDKVFIRFPRAFWDTAQNHTLATGMSESTPARPFPVESLFLGPAYAPETNPAGWRTEIISFSGLPGQHAQPVLMFFVYGQWGRHITGLVRGMKQGPNSNEYHRILDRHFRPYYSRMPNYDAASADCEPLEFMSTDWQNDPLAGYGSFTNQPVGSGDCAEHFRVLREVMGEDRGIWFAGEHTSPPGGLGTVTGAYWSGEEAARRVARRHGIVLYMPPSH